MKCKCGCEEFYTEKHGNNTGLYCKSCGKWIKWLNKDEARLYEHEHDENKNGLDMIKNLKEFINALDEEINRQYEGEPSNAYNSVIKRAIAYEKVKMALENILNEKRYCDYED